MQFHVDISFRTVVANIDDVKSFTVYIKTLVTYGLFDINVFVEILMEFSWQ